MPRQYKRQSYDKDEVAVLVAQSSSVAEILRALEKCENGGNHSHLSRRIVQWGLDTSHFTGQSHRRGKPGYGRLGWQEILVEGPIRKPAQLRRALRDSGRPDICEGCGIGPEWMGHPLVLQIDHIAAIKQDNRPGSIRFLCPNCHSQTETFGSKKLKGVKLSVKPSQPRIEDRRHQCKDCDRPISPKATRCKACAGMGRRCRIAWPSIDILRSMLAARPYTSVARELGVSDNAIRKHLKSHASATGRN